MKFLSLKSDFLFKKFFTEEPEFLIDFINCVLDLPKDRRIKALTVLNPEIPRELVSEKTSILDIHAIDEKDEHLCVEMQAFPQSFFVKRALYYWAKTYTSQLSRGEKYHLLKKVYTINILDFAIIDTDDYHTVFDISDRKHPEVQLTEDLEIHFLELPKYRGSLAFADRLETWMYIISNTETIGENEMRTIVDKQPLMGKVFKELDRVSMNKTVLNEYEIRKRARMDEDARMDYSFHKGVEQGIERGIEQDKHETAQKMLKKDLPVELIVEITGLSKEAIEELKE